MTTMRILKRGFHHMSSMMGTSIKTRTRDAASCACPQRQREQFWMYTLVS